MAFDADSATKHQELGDEDDETILGWMRRHAEQQLAAGVTTVRDLGDRRYLGLMLRDEFAGHPSAGPDVVAAGMDGVEHVSFFTADGVEADWRVVDAMADAGTFVGATEAWLPDGPMLAPHLRDRLEKRSADFVRMHRQGVRLVCCSDAGAGPRKPHGVLPRGVIHFGSIGLSNAEALASATTVAAQACGVADRKGIIAQGYDADLIAVAGNPLQDLEALLHVREVIRMGRLVHQNGSAGDSQVAAPTT